MKFQVLKKEWPFMTVLSPLICRKPRNKCIAGKLSITQHHTPYNSELHWYECAGADFTGNGNDESTTYHSKNSVTLMDAMLPFMQ
jgi:hypothetical protein